MRKIFISVVLLFFSGGVFSAQLEEKADNSQQKRDIVLEISLRHSLEKELNLYASQKQLRNHKFFQDLCDSEQKIVLPCDSEAEISAWTKIFQFVNSEDDSQPIFEAQDLAELIFLVFKHEIDPLGLKIAEFIESEVDQQIKQDRSKILGELSKEAIQKLCTIFSIASGTEQDWFNKTRGQMTLYFHALHQQEDFRIKDLRLKFRADYFALINASRAAGERESTRSKKEQILSNKVDVQVSKIHRALIDKAVGKSCRCGFSDTLPVRSHSFLVRKGLAKHVVDALQKRLGDYEVFINVGDWHRKSHLCAGERWPKTPGGYCASVCGLGVCLSLFPCQTAFCLCHANLCPYSCAASIDRCDLSSTQIAGAIRHCVYKTATFQHAWIVVKPKDYLLESVPPILPPLREEML